MIFFHVARSKTLDVYNSFQWNKDIDKVKITEIMDKFERIAKNLTLKNIYF